MALFSTRFGDEWKQIVNDGNVLDGNRENPCRTNTNYEREQIVRIKLRVDNIVFDQLRR